METQTRLRFKFWMGVAFGFAAWSSILWVLNITTPIAWTLALGFFAILIIQHLSSLPKVIAAVVSAGLGASIFAHPDLAREASLSITQLVVFLLGCAISGALVIGLLGRLTRLVT